MRGGLLEAQLVHELPQLSPLDPLGPGHVLRDLHQALSVLYCTVLYCTVLYCNVLYCTVLYCTVLYLIMRLRLIRGLSKFQIFCIGFHYRTLVTPTTAEVRKIFQQTEIFQILYCRCVEGSHPKFRKRSSSRRRRSIERGLQS